MPPTAAAQFALGLVLEKAGRHQHAARCFAACIALDAAHAGGHHHYGRVLCELGQFESALAMLERAAALDASNPRTHTDLSSAWSSLGHFKPARIAAATAIQLDPAAADAHNNLAHCLLNLDRSAEAVAHYDAALALRRDYPKAAFGRALALLKSGDFARGWDAYEGRWRDCQRPRADLTMPAWNGEPLAGRSLLLHAEQGLGDTLQFIRFAPQAAAQGAHVVVQAPPPLVRLLRRVAGVAAVLGNDDPLPATDLHCPIASLPRACSVRLGTIPQPPYLPAPPRPRREMPTVGLVWAGDARLHDPRSNRIDRRRSTTLESFAPLFAIPGIAYRSFQLGPARQETRLFEGVVTDAMDGVTDFADTAERLATIDLLISVDTAMVHLAGACNWPVWLLSRADACWRWLEHRDDSPWYPSMRIYRQPAPGDWAGLMARVADDLRAWAAERGAHTRELPR